MNNCNKTSKYWLRPRKQCTKNMVDSESFLECCDNARDANNTKELCYEDIAVMGNQHGIITLVESSVIPLHTKTSWVNAHFLIEHIPARSDFTPKRNNSTKVSITQMQHSKRLTILLSLNLTRKKLVFQYFHFNCLLTHPLEIMQCSHWLWNQSLSFERNHLLSILILASLKTRILLR